MAHLVCPSLDLDLVLQVPFDSPPEAVLKAGLGPEAEVLFGSGTSRRRFGWPSGLDGSQTIRPSKPASRTLVPTSSLMAISLPEPRLAESEPSYRSAASARSSARTNHVLRP